MQQNWVPSRGPLHSYSKVERVVTAVWRLRNRSSPEFSTRVQSLSDSVLGPVTTSASDDEFSMPTNTSWWNRGSHVPPLACLGASNETFSPNSLISIWSIRLCSLCSDIFPSVPMSHLFIRCARTSWHSILASGGPLCQCDAPTQLAGVLASHQSKRALDDPTGFLPLAGSLERSGFPLDGACAISLANASIAGSLSHLSVTLVPKLALQAVSHQRIRDPSTHGAPLQGPLERRISCAMNTQCPIAQNSYGRCVVIYSLYSLDVVTNGSSPVNSRHQISVSSSSISSSVSPINSMSFPSFLTFSMHCHARNDTRSVRERCGLQVSVRLNLSSTLTCPAVKKLACSDQTRLASFILSNL